MQYRNNKAMIYRNIISGYEAYYYIKEGDFGGEDITFIENPTADIMQNFAISSRSDKEESQKFFNGDCTAEECAEATQNRVSIYLSEKQ